jgi:hypothetical protein
VESKCPGFMYLLHRLDELGGGRQLDVSFAEGVPLEIGGSSSVGASGAAQVLLSISVFKFLMQRASSRWLPALGGGRGGTTSCSSSTASSSYYKSCSPIATVQSAVVAVRTPIPHTACMFVFRVILVVNSDYFPNQN